jgi:hypothetical protein
MTSSEEIEARLRERQRCINRLRELIADLDRTHTGPRETLTTAIEALTNLKED